MTLPRRTDVDVLVFPPDSPEKCGEGCGRAAVIGLDGPDGCTYCGTCLEHLVELGREFVDAVSNANDHLKALAQ
jgi:hypothetical protein